MWLTAVLQKLCPQPERGLPAASLAARRLGRALTLLASLWFLAVGLWEIGAPFGAGHYAAASAVTLAGENMLRLPTWFPITEHVLGAASGADCYCHHPFGIFWTAALFVGVLGHHDWVCRLPAVLLSALTPALLWALGRALWGPLAGALAALAFVFTPIALAYANFNALEVPVIFGTLLSSLGYVRFQQTSERRFSLLTLGALVYALNADWAAYVYGAGLVALLSLRSFIPALRPEPSRLRASRNLLLGLVAVLLITGGFYLFALHELGQLSRLLGQGRARSRGFDLPLLEVLAARRYWLELMFTPLALAVCLLSAPLLAARVIARRCELEAVPLVLLAMAVFQYLVFKQGADVHIFWPHYFAPFFALSVGLLAHGLQELGQRARRRFALQTPASVLVLGAAPWALGLMIPLAMARDALTTLVYARKTAGRFNEGGRFMQPDKDKVAMMAWLARRTRPGQVVGLAPNMRQSLWVPWVLGRPVHTSRQPFAAGATTFVTDGRFESASVLRRLARRWRTTVVGPFWIAERASPAGLTGAFSIERRAPEGLERFFVASTHAVHEVVADAFATWELAAHFDGTAEPRALPEPRDLEQQRIAHNFALERGDLARAKELRERLLRALDTRSRTRYADGTSLLGCRYEAGSSDVLSVLFEASGPASLGFVMHARVVERMPYSLVPMDELERELGSPPAIPRSSWKPGYLYSSVTELLKRPGTEQFYGSWRSVEPLPADIVADAERRVLLLSLPP